MLVFSQSTNQLAGSADLFRIALFGGDLNLISPPCMTSLAVAAMVNMAAGSGPGGDYHETEGLPEHPL